ncbi:MAG TPA: flagellar hook-associated protein FlgL [Chloroflexota bacterium]|nr:flagellar hook-associated protein FlgL [Chloroflexota bacterium]
MRITHRMISDTTIRNLRSNLTRLESLHNSITTGKRLSRPSDDPAAVARSLTYSADIAAGEAYLRTMDSATSWMSATDSALDQAGNVLQRARELAVQGANGGSMTPSDMQSLGAEVDQLLQQLGVIGNASLRGQRLFAGQDIDNDPFAVSAVLPGYTYTGDNGQMRREYDVNAYLIINTPGEATFAPAFTAQFNLRDHLNAGNATAVTGDLSEVDQALETILSARAEVGAKMNRVEAAQGRQELLQVNLEGLRSKNEDTDFAEAVSKFSVQETVYKASLEAGGKAIQPSLLDYLR